MDKQLCPKERKCYYDEMGMEIREGDLLEVYHFRSAPHGKKEFMYHIALLESNPDGYWWAAKEYYRTEDKGHYCLLAVADKTTGIIMGTRIISHAGDGWRQADQLRKEARNRLKNIQPTQP